MRLDRQQINHQIELEILDMIFLKYKLLRSKENSILFCLKFESFPLSLYRYARSCFKGGEYSLKITTVIMSGIPFKHL